MVNANDFYKHVRGLLPLISMFMLSGCIAQQAPVFTLLGSYFPGWIASALFGIVVTVIVRMAFIHLGIDDVLPARLLVYTCLALAVAFICSLLIFAR